MYNVVKTAILIIFFSCAFLITSSGQVLLIGIESGYQFFGGKVRDDSNIRVDPSSAYSYSTYGDYDPYTTVNSAIEYVGAGFHVERLSASEKISFASGIKYSVFRSELSAPGDDYFYYRFMQEGLDTWFFRVQSMTQINKCLTIPLQLRYFPFGGRKIRFYVKLSVDNNITIASSDEIKFLNPAMSGFGSKILDLQDQPGSFTSLIYLAGGIRVCPKGRVNGGFELVGPAGYLTPAATGMVSPSAGLGIQMNLVYTFKRSTDE